MAAGRQVSANLIAQSFQLVSKYSIITMYEFILADARSALLACSQRLVDVFAKMRDIESSGCFRLNERHGAWRQTVEWQEAVK